LHAEITIAALKAGKHVLTEARMAMNAEEGEAMVAASLDRPDLVAQIVPSPFTLKWDATLKKILAAGELGELREISFTKALGLNVDSSASLNWRQDRALSGNNTLMLGIYYEVVQRWLGEEPERLLANGAVFTKQRQKGPTGETVAVEIPETIDVIAEYECGLRLNGRMTGLELGAGSDGFVIAGSKGTLRLDLREGTLRIALMGAKEKVVEPAPEDVADWNVEADFVKSIRDGAPIDLTNFADGLAYMRFTDAAIKSLAEDSAWVSL
jgi:predicted dehydrogenase